MSGPKVIRFVTREEVVAICEGLFKRLDHSIARWTEAGRRNDAIDDRDLAAVEARRDALRRLLAEDRFLDVQKQVVAEMDFLRVDLEERLARAVEAAAQRRHARRRLAAAAKTVLDDLRRDGRVLPNEMARSLEQVALNRVESSEAERLIARAFGALAEATAPQSESGAARTLAETLGAGQESLSFADWLARRPQPPEDEASRRIDRHIAELEIFGDGAAAAFVERAASIAQDGSASRRALLADSLTLDLAAAVKAARAREAALAALAERRAEIELMSGAAGLVAQIDAALAAKDAVKAPALEERATAFAIERRRALAAAARREAVLKGLARLGYEVGEEMATVWASEGRLILRKADASGRGVEIGGAGERVQLRPVRFGTAADAARDRDVEILWCFDFERLAAGAGEAIVIEKAAPIGRVPVKVVVDEKTVEVKSQNTVKKFAG